MQAIGIVAEYNPFHNGHQYHIAQAKTMAEADGVIAVMSGSFTQRGEAAVFDKWTRTELALTSGVDLVLELPTAFSVRSAAYFASGAVQTLAATGICKYLSCGAESENTADLSRLALYLANEPEEYQNTLQDYLQKGLSFPDARQKALEALNIPGFESISQPNNILALHYLETIHRCGLSLTPLLVARRGSYNDTSVPADSAAFASASAIRRLFAQQNSGWVQQVPAPVATIIRRQMQKGCTPIQMESFALAIFTLLRRSTPEELSEILEISEGLEHRMYDAAFQTETLDDLCTAIKSRRYTYTRIQRTLCHLLLNMKQDMNFTAPQYIRILGFNETGQKLLKEMKKTAQLPVITRPARQRGLLNSEAQRMLALDYRATAIHMTGYPVSVRPNAAIDLLQMPVKV